MPSIKNGMTWHAQAVADVIQALETNIETGLKPEEVLRRQKEYGLNELIERGTKPPWRILIDQFRETMVIVLIIAATVSAFLGISKTLSRLSRLWY